MPIDRREFIGISGAGIVAVGLGLHPKRTSRYVGKCQQKYQHCTGPDYYPLTQKPDIGHKWQGSNGPMLCQYHGNLISKLRLLTLPQLEYLCRYKDVNTRNLITHLMHTLLPNGAGPFDTVYMHHIRTKAMKVSNEYWKRNWKHIFRIV